MILRFSSFHESENRVFVRPFMDGKPYRVLSIEDAIRFAKEEVEFEIDKNSFLGRIDAIQRQIDHFFGRPGSTNRRPIAFPYLQEQRALVDVLVNYCGMTPEEGAKLLEGYNR